jgi:hypothetical protein
MGNIDILAKSKFIKSSILESKKQLIPKIQLTILHKIYAIIITFIYIFA